jgi:hypothetical protein
MPKSYDGVEPTIPEGYSADDFRRHDITLITMRVIEPTRRCAASYIARFEYQWWHDYFMTIDYDGYRDYVLAPELTTWLKMNASNYEVSMDRGDWGEGSPICEIDFARLDECELFIADHQHTIHGLVYTDSGINKMLIRKRAGLE